MMSRRMYFQKNRIKKKKKGNGIKKLRDNIFYFLLAHEKKIVPVNGPIGIHGTVV